MKVKVKSDRHCCHCGNVIPKGTESITLNRYRRGRRWLCLDCYEFVMDIKHLGNVCKGISFDDEGASYYFNGELADVLEGFRSRRKNNG